MAMARSKSILCFMLYLVTLTKAQYKDDTDYNVEFYQDPATDYEQDWDNHSQDIEQDDFYILSDFEDANSQNIYSNAQDSSGSYDSNANSFKTSDPLSKHLDWYKIPERVYRYTKHRIPGYDYDELDYLGIKNFQVCDERSVWTHCLCQFTCTEPDVVDCYTPCKSGCECKENYVFDEKLQQCLLPEECTSTEGDIIYK